MDILLLSVGIAGIISVVVLWFNSMEVECFEVTNGPIVTVTPREAEIVKAFGCGDVYLKAHCQIGLLKKRRTDLHFRAPSYFTVVCTETQHRLIRHAARRQGSYVTKVIDLQTL